MPPFAIFRVERIRTISDLEGATRHGHRQDTGQHFDPARTLYNKHWDAAGSVTAPVDWVRGVEDAIVRLGATVRQGAPVAAELFTGASAAFFMAPDGQNLDLEKVYRWAELNIEIFRSRFGQAMVAARLDLDEATPHMAICVLPTYAKTTKHGHKTVVSYRRVFGGETRDDARRNLVEWQDWYAFKMARLGLHRGVSKTLTGRQHLTHQAYARQRQLEDDRRRQALRQAEVRANELAARLTAAELRLQRVAKLEAVAIDYARRATQKLLAAEEAYEFMALMAGAVTALDTNGEAAALLELKQETIDRWRAYVDGLVESGPSAPVRGI